MPHKDFDLRSKEYHVFHAAEYSWQEHCYVWINQSCGEIAQLLDTQLETIQSLTYRTFSGSDFRKKRESFGDESLGEKECKETDILKKVRRM